MEHYMRSPLFHSFCLSGQIHLPILTPQAGKASRLSAGIWMTKEHLDDKGAFVWQRSIKFANLGWQFPANSVKYHRFLRLKCCAWSRRGICSWFFHKPKLPLNVFSLSWEKQIEKRALPGEGVTLPLSSCFYSAVSRMLPRHGTKPTFIAGGSSCLCQREGALQKTCWQVQPFQKRSTKEKLLQECCHGSNGTLCLRKKHFILYLHPYAEPLLNIASMRQSRPAHQEGCLTLQSQGSRSAAVVETALHVLRCPTAHRDPCLQSASCGWVHPVQIGACSTCPLLCTAPVTRCTPLFPPLYGSYRI